MGAGTAKNRRARDDSKPRQDFDAVGMLGRKAVLLAQNHANEIGNRLQAGFVDGLVADIKALDTAVPGVIVTKDGQVQLTAAQTKALGTGHKRVKAVRTTVKSASPDKDVLLAYGVGTKVNRLVVKDVKAAIKKILDRATAKPTEAEDLGILADDIAGLTAAHKAIEDADRAAADGRASGPVETKKRNATARRILKGVKKIAGAGMLAFPDNETIYGKFEALVTKKAA